MSGSENVKCNSQTNDAEKCKGNDNMVAVIYEVIIQHCYHCKIRAEQYGLITGHQILY